MFNSISSQLNRYNGRSQVSSGGLYPSTAPNQHYFPSGFMRYSSTQYRQSPTYQHYSPKSRLGMLNQRIEQEKDRRDSMRRKSGKTFKDGYVSDGQRSFSSANSRSNRNSFYQKSSFHEPQRQRNYYQKPGFTPTQPILGYDSQVKTTQPPPQRTIAKPYAREQTYPPMMVQSDAETKLRVPPLQKIRRPPVEYASDAGASESSRSSKVQRMPVQQQFLTRQSEPDFMQTVPASSNYPSFKKVIPKEVREFKVREVPYQHSSRLHEVNPSRNQSESEFYDAENHHNLKSVNQSFESRGPPTRAHAAYSRSAPTQPSVPMFAIPTSPQVNQAKSPVFFHEKSLGGQLSTMMDKSGNGPKYLGIGLIVVVLLMMIYEIIR